MGIKLTNNAFGTLAAGINSSATSITLTTGQGARFPTLSAGDYFYATLIDTSNNLEIVKCTARSTDVLTVVRAQETTTARSYSTGDRLEIRLTAQTFLDATAITPAAVSDQANTATGYFQVAKGTTAQRPVSPTTGMIRFNTDLNYLEEYRQGQWIALSSVFTADGGTITTYVDGGVNYKVHTFTSSGIFTVLSGTGSVDYLIVGGGGGGGGAQASNDCGGGGGGAGGMLTGTITASTQGYTVTIGGGGSGGGEQTSGSNGGNSSVFGVTCIGGGGGAARVGGGSSSTPGNGGSGGGGTCTGLIGLGTAGQGNDGGGGSGTAAGGSYGGGGKGSAGGSPSNGGGGAGGTGATSSISGTSLAYAGGGGGGEGGGPGGRGIGGSGVGGDGSENNNTSPRATNGMANRGGGGGGNGGFCTGTGGNGGSGVVIIRYAI
jgi:hypothetical protein